MKLGVDVHPATPPTRLARPAPAPKPPIVQLLPAKRVILTPTLPALVTTLMKLGVDVHPATLPTRLARPAPTPLIVLQAPATLVRHICNQTNLHMLLISPPYLTLPSQVFTHLSKTLVARRVRPPTRLARPAPTPLIVQQAPAILVRQIC